MTNLHSEPTAAEIAELYKGAEQQAKSVVDYGDKKVSLGNEKPLEHTGTRNILNDGYWGVFDAERKQFPLSPKAITEEVVKELLVKLAAHGVDDISFQGAERVFCKIGNGFYPVSQRVLTDSEVDTCLITLTRESAPGRVKSGKDINSAYTVAGEEPGKGITHYRFRVCATACQGLHGGKNSIEITMRSLAPYPLSMDELKVPQGIRDLAFPKNGIVFVVGETGSGKSTLLGSVIREHACAPVGKHIVTYEDPIEADIRAIPNKTALVAQTEIGEMLPDYVSALPNALRRNPDVILYGELRTADVIARAITGANSGQLIYTTLHAESVASTFERLVSDFPEKEQASRMRAALMVTRGIVFQCLVDTVDGGRVPVQEWLKIGTEEQEVLSATPASQFVSRLRELIADRGQPLLKDLEEKKHIVTPEWYRMLHDTYGKTIDTQVHDSEQ